MKINIALVNCYVKTPVERLADLNEILKVADLLFSPEAQLKFEQHGILTAEIVDPESVSKIAALPCVLDVDDGKPRLPWYDTGEPEGSWLCAWRAASDFYNDFYGKPATPEDVVAKYQDVLRLVNGVWRDSWPAEPGTWGTSPSSCLNQSKKHAIELLQKMGRSDLIQRL